jgi:hypothetical protein
MQAFILLSLPPSTSIAILITIKDLRNAAGPITGDSIFSDILLAARSVAKALSAPFRWF